jgi:hypothetical protein
MLRGTLAFLALVAFAVAGNELRKALLRRGLRAPAIEGPLFLAVGFALGDHALGLFPPDLLGNLHAVTLLGLAWIGLVFGLQIDINIMRRLRPWHRRVGVLVLLVIGAMVMLLGLLLGISVTVMIGLCAIAMVASPVTIDVLARVRLPADRAAMRLLKLVMAFSGLPAVVIFAVAAPLWHPAMTIHGAGLLARWHYLVGYILEIGIGVILGYALITFTRGVSDRFQLLTIIAGILSALAGATAVLGISPLPAAVVAGALVTNRCIFPHRILKVAHSFEIPVVIALLVVVGASWRGVHFSWPVFALMVIGRLAGLIAGGAVLEQIARKHQVKLAVPLIGCGLLSQGELAIGLLVAMIGATELAGVLEAVVAAMVVNQLAGQWWLRRHLLCHPSRGAGS